ncbi:MAG TPA: hypothetical protein ENN17_09700, partial [bacterium]|nr:hypothetical protein [bacterium]
MKKQSSRFIVAGLIILLFCPVVRGQVTWSDPIPIAEGSSPDLVIDRNTGRLHIVTKRFDNMYTVIDSTGRILNQESIPNSNDSYPTWSAGPSIAVDRNGNPHVCFKKRRSGTWNYDIFYTTRQNNRWSAPLRIAEKKYRAFHVRMAADETDYIHIIYGEVPEGERTWGPVTYCKIRYGIMRHEQTQIAPAHFRDDGGLEIDVDDRNQVHVVLGCPGLWTNTNAGLISYYRGAPEAHQLYYVTRLQTEPGQGRTSFPDIFTDPTGFVHVSYGSTADAQADGNPVVRYVRYHDNLITRNRIVTRSGDLDPYAGGAIWGVSTIAATDDGQGIVIAYLTNPNGTGALRASMSADSGKTWYAPALLAESSGGEEARNRPVIRAFRDHFYLVYPDNSDGRVKMRFLWNGGDGIPVAVLDSAYTSLEGHPITFDASRSYDVGLSPGIVEYTWDFNNNGIADAVTTTPTVTHTYPDDFSGHLSLIVRDKWGQADTAYAAVEIRNVPPTVDLGPDRHLEEGDTLVLDAVVTDPGIYDDHTVYFRIDDGIWRYENPLIHVFEDDGDHTIVAWVTDNDGGVGYDTVRVHVANVPPSAVARIPRAGSTGMDLRFEATATDPGIHDVPTLVYEWDLDDDGIFERRGRIITASFAFEGFYPIRLRVTDKDGGQGFDSDVLQILDAPPEIMEIPDQIFPEGSVLPPIHLDEYVTDPVVDPDRLTWSVSGHTDLIVTLQNRVLQVAVPDSQWHGEETLRLVCTNHITLSDTGEVTYIILYVNDPPRWIS